MKKLSFALTLAVALLFPLFVPPSNSSELNAQNFINNVLQSGGHAYDFSAYSPEADMFALFIRATGAECDSVTGGTVYPFKSGSGFDSDAYCDNGAMHMINYSASRSSAHRLFINGETYVTPGGWE